MYAADRGHTETAEVLLREGADVSVQDKVNLISDYAHHQINIPLLGLIKYTGLTSSLCSVCQLHTDLYGSCNVYCVDI